MKFNTKPRYSQPFIGPDLLANCAWVYQTFRKNCATMLAGIASKFMQSTFAKRISLLCFSVAGCTKLCPIIQNNSSRRSLSLAPHAQQPEKFCAAYMSCRPQWQISRRFWLSDDQFSHDWLDPIFSNLIRYAKHNQKSPGCCEAWWIPPEEFIL